MGMNTPTSGESVHIAFFGLRNAGKSSLVNAVTGQTLSIISEVKGTTTDPVRKTMELLPVGPAVIIDTPGIDDEGVLGQMRVERTRRILDETDVAVLVVDALRGMETEDKQLLGELEKRKIPHLTAYNKCELLPECPRAGEGSLYVSAERGTRIWELKEAIAALARRDMAEKHIAADLIEPGDMVVLITPIDSSAPKGRLILPQQQTIRDILEAGAFCTVVRDTEYPQALRTLAKPPKLVITDSQVFALADRETPKDILLTSFSILFARYKGSLERTVMGAYQLDRLRDGDKVLISEGCTHHRQCGDIGTVKLPAWIKKYTGRELEFCFTSGGEFPRDVQDYSLIIHCGGCMLNEQEMKSRIGIAAGGHVPFTNYGIAIAKLHGILERSLSPFPELLEKLRG